MLLTSTPRLYNTDILVRLQYMYSITKNYVIQHIPTVPAFQMHCCCQFDPQCCLALPEGSELRPKPEDFKSWKQMGKLQKVCQANEAIVHYACIMCNTLFDFLRVDDCHHLHASNY